MSNEINDAIRVAPLVVLPRHVSLTKVLVSAMTVDVLVEHGREGVADKVARHHIVPSRCSR